MSYVEKHIQGNQRKVSWMQSIRVRMVLIILIASSLVLAVSGFMTYRYFKEVKSEELSLLTKVTVNRLANHLVTPMWDVNNEGVGSLLEAEMGEEKILKIVVLDEDGSSIFAARERTSNGIVKTIDPKVSADVFTASQVVSNGEAKLGEVLVFLKKTSMYSEMEVIAKLIALVTVILGISLTIVTTLGLSIIVVRPIRNLTNSAEQITMGDFRQNFDLSRRDEIGYLSSTIDRMQYGLRVAAMRLSKNNAKTA